MKNKKVLPLLLYLQGRHRYITRITQVPELTAILLLESRLHIKKSSSRYIQDLSFEMHVWYLLYIAFIYKKDPVSTLNYLDLLNERFDVIKQYFHMRIDQFGIITELDKPFSYFAMNASGRLKKNTLTLVQTNKVVQIHNKCAAEMLSVLSSAIPSQFIELYANFTKELPISFSCFDSKIEGYSTVACTVTKHRYWYALCYFEGVFIKGEFS